MARQSRDNYQITGDPNIDYVLGEIARRLDVVEGLLPDLDTGFYELSSSKEIETSSINTGDITDFATYFNQPVRSDSVPIFAGFAVAGDVYSYNTNGIIRDVLISIRDASETTIHQFPIRLLANTNAWQGFY